MNFSKTSLLITSLIILFCNLTAYGAEEARDASEYERSILNLTVTRATPDPEAPWATQNLDLTGYAGVVVGENKILTQASILTNAAYIQAQKVDDVEKIPLRIIFADYEANLALLGPADGKSLSGVKILPIGPDIPVGSDVWLVAIENERQLQRIALRAMDIRLREASTGGMSLPTYSLSGQSRSICKSDPIIRKGALTGLCVAISETQPQALTAGVISHFLADKHTPETYRGFGSFGITLHPVRSPWQRKLLGVPAGKGALRVASVSETSPFSDCIKDDDILTGVDDIAVDHRGFYQHSQWGAVPIRHYVISKYSGDSVVLRFSRAGKLQTCSRVLRRYSSQDNAVPGPASDGRAPHIVFGGLIFRELSADFLSVFGREWPRTSPPALAFIYNYRNDPTLIRRRDLVLSNVLADEFNAGYEKLSNLILESVNGRPAISVEELKVHLKLPGIQRDGIEYAQFDFRGGVQVVLPYQGIDVVHKRIAKAYAVSDSKSFFSR
jgi:hypothetical protein